MQAASRLLFAGGVPGAGAPRRGATPCPGWSLEFAGEASEYALSTEPVGPHGLAVQLTRAGRWLRLVRHLDVFGLERARALQVVLGWQALADASEAAPPPALHLLVDRVEAGKRLRQIHTRLVPDTAGSRAGARLVPLAQPIFATETYLLGVVFTRPTRLVLEEIVLRPVTQLLGQHLHHAPEANMTGKRRTP